ncbi:hypothetical protein [Enterovirga sp. CN4-39]|uniref:hypothetical protein n=1 Tax=Enterovirga sp. CN4-39 TaxID=3400910 RepID=UPI003C0EC59F
MKTIILAVVAAIALAAVSAYFLAENQKLAYQAYSTSGARVTPTDNLVGPTWNGDPNTSGTAKNG